MNGFQKYIIWPITLLCLFTASAQAIEPGVYDAWKDPINYYNPKGVEVSDACQTNPCLSYCQTLGYACTKTTINYKNQMMNNCMNARSLAPDKKRAEAEFDCLPTAVDDQGNITEDKDFKNWNDTLIMGKNQSPITGFYTMNGKRCDNAASASVQCPVEARAKFVFECEKGDPINYSNSTNKCAIAKSVRTYRAIFQSVQVPGKMPIKTVIVGDKGISNVSNIAIPVSMATINSANKNEHKCAEKNSLGQPLFQKGLDPYGLPICITDPKVNEMMTDICKVKMQQLWTQPGGGTDTSGCSGITLTKNFKFVV
jgi:hypothetical protein